jgi:hypothetical protein
MPTCLRRGATFYDANGWQEGPHQSNREQIAAEVSTLMWFFALADQTGLPLPEDTQQTRTLLRRLKVGVPQGWFDEALRKGKLLWPPDELLSVMALAQHHGISSRLLDWTYSPTTAAYFAAKRAARGLISGEFPEDDKLCVWGLLLPFVQRHSAMAGPHEDVRRIVHVTAPAAGNQNLQAQQGLFLLDRRPAMDPNGPVTVETLDHVLANEYPAPDKYFLHKVQLPVSRAGDVLRLLAKERVHAGTLFPGFGGVVEALTERMLWDAEAPIPDMDDLDDSFFEDHDVVVTPEEDE